MNFLHLKNRPIFDQLQIEETLLRSDQHNWCIVGEGTPPSIVMGISGKPELLIDIEKVRDDRIPLIKRFSGGGTVFVDEETLFVTFIFQKEEHPFAPFPEKIMRWSEGIYKNVFELDHFHLRENDFCIGEKKCGGNAQYIRKERWLHHTSFLWDYKETSMDYLLFPPKTPAYRKGRSHSDFLCKLSDFLPDKTTLIEKLKTHLSKFYPLREIFPEELETFLDPLHRKTTTLVTP
jgi:lipoate---protein ligase